MDHIYNFSIKYKGCIPKNNSLKKNSSIEIGMFWTLGAKMKFDIWVIVWGEL